MNRSNIKAVFFDIDGTILDHKTGRVPAGTRQAMKKLKENGIGIAACSGRHLSEIRQLDVNDIVFDDYALLNGQVCLGRDRKLFAGSPIAEPDLSILLEAFRQKELPTVLAEEERLYINPVSSEMNPSLKNLSVDLLPTDEYRGDPVYMVMFYASEDRYEPIVKRLTQCQCISYPFHAADIYSVCGGKKEGMRKIMEKEHWNQNEIMAFGDGENDLDMLEYAGIGIAMGNAPEAVKKHADAVCRAVDQNGIAEILEKYGLI